MKPVALRSRGLNLTPSPHVAPEGSMVTARNVVIQRDHVVETARGSEAVSQEAFSRLFPLSAGWLARSTAGLAISGNASAWTEVAPGNQERVTRVIEAGGETLLNTGERVTRQELDHWIAYGLEPAGVPQALAIEVWVGSAAGSALPPQKAAAYRVVLARHGADGRLLLGAPSGYAVARNTHETEVRDVVLSIPIPRDFPGGLVQVYRSAASDLPAEPDDELGLVAEVAASAPGETMKITDATPDGFRGAALYTNASQQGALAAAFPPPLAAEIAQFRGSVFWADVTDRARLPVWMMSPPADGDTITIGGLTYTAVSMLAVDRTLRRFWMGTGTSVVQKIRDSVASLLATINFQAGRVEGRPTAQSTDAADGGAPGHFDIVAGPVGVSPGVSVSVSAAGKWRFARGTSASPQRAANELRWSAPEQPEAAPLLNSAKIGNAAEPILRIIGTRDSLWILKAEGVWRLSGAAGVWDISPFDPTLRLIGRETVVALDNAVWCLSDQGVVRLTESGVEIVSRPVEPLLAPLLAPYVRGTVDRLAFAVGCEPDHTYRLWLPETLTATSCTRCLQFSALTETWTDVPTHGAVHATVEPVTGRLALASADGVRIERRAMTGDDASGVPFAEIEWTAIAAGDPTTAKHWQELVLSFLSATPFAAAEIGFRTEVTREEQVIDVTGAFAGATGEPLAVRVLVPLEARRGAQIQVRFRVEMEDGASPAQRFALDGVSLKFQPTGGRVSR